MSPRSAPADRSLGGRPRDPQIDGAILTAVRELLAEEGYVRLSFETVARRAGVTRPTIYRRWPSKAHLVHDAVFPSNGAGLVLIADTGDFAADVRRMISDTVTSYSRPEARAALPGLFSDLHPNRELRAEVVDGLRNHALAEFRALVARAQERGDVREGVDPDVVFDTIVGAAFTRVVSEEDVPAGYVEALTEAVVLGAASRP
ncbi:TetR/AcrR family transcriptional regulator [Yinghuangia sp. YIM S09857]|uniref:TetR/AcrR family transcriptional regulator n=1 Tax=Yinghuangia sp. YIM S09857 TaxID=3436929 RepID=UPI003F52F9CB